MQSALHIYRSMFGLNGLQVHLNDLRHFKQELLLAPGLPGGLNWFLGVAAVRGPDGNAWLAGPADFLPLAVAMVIVFWLPNSSQYAMGFPRVMEINRQSDISIRKLSLPQVLTLGFLLGSALSYTQSTFV